MVEDYSIGHLRGKYLDLANMGFAQNNFIASSGYINDFLATIKEESEAGKEIKIEFDKITTIKRQRIEEIKKNAEKLGYLEKKDFENRGREDAEVNAIHDKMVVCWKVALNVGLFND